MLILFYALLHLATQYARATPLSHPTSAPKPTYVPSPSGRSIVNILLSSDITFTLCVTRVYILTSPRRKNTSASRASGPTSSTGSWLHLWLPNSFSMLPIFSGGMRGSFAKSWSNWMPGWMLLGDHQTPETNRWTTWKKLPMSALNWSIRERSYRHHQRNDQFWRGIEGCNRCGWWIDPCGCWPHLKPHTETTPSDRRSKEIDHWNKNTSDRDHTTTSGTAASNITLAMVWRNNGLRVFYCDGRLCIWHVTSFARRSLHCCHSGWIFDLRQRTVHQAPNLEQRWDCGSKQSRFAWEVAGLCSGPVDGHQLYCPKGEWVTYYTGGVECGSSCGSDSYCIWTLVAQTFGRGSPDISTESRCSWNWFWWRASNSLNTAKRTNISRLGLYALENTIIRCRYRCIRQAVRPSWTFTIWCQPYNVARYGRFRALHSRWIKVRVARRSRAIRQPNKLYFYIHQK